MTASNQPAVSRSARWLALAGTLLSLPVLFVGFFNDDFIHRMALSGAWSGYRRSPFALYDFLRGPSEGAPLVDAGILPWFSDPALTVRFFRPLSSASLAFDLLVFGKNALLAHVHSLLWLLVATLLARRIQRALLPERAAFWATLLFVLAGSHVESTAWLAARHVLVSGTFGLAAWVALIRWLDERKLGWLGLCVALLGLGFLSSEAVLTVVPFLLGHAWFGQRAAPRSALPAVVITLVTLIYLAAYARAGFGTHHIGSYVNPFDAPLRFAGAVVERVPLIACELFVSVPMALSYAGVGPALVLRALGVLAATLVVTLVIRRRGALGARAALLVWLPLGLLASVVPLCGTILDGRVLLVPMVASSALLGVLISDLLARRADRSQSRALGAVGLGLLLFLHCGLSPLVRVAFAFNYQRVSMLQQAIPERASLACAKNARILLVNGSDPAISMYGGALYLAAEGPQRPSFTVLSMAPNDLELTRDGERSFVLSTLGARKTHFIEQLYRPPDNPLKVADRVALNSLTATVLETSSLGPLRVRFELAEPLDSPSYCFTSWQPDDARLTSLKLPASGSVRIRYQLGLLGM